MSCACVRKLADLLKALVPPLEIKLPEIPVLESLAAIAAPLAAARGVSSAQLAMIANMPPLPPLPLEGLQLASMQAAMQAAGEMATMGISPISPLAAPRLAATIGALNINFAMVPLPAPPPASLLKLSMVCARVAAVRTTLGIDLLSPAAMPQLKLALAAATPIAPPPSLPTLAAYATVAGGASSLGGIQAMLPVLTAMASLSIPPITIPISALTNLLATLAAIENVQGALGINPCLPGAIPAIQLRLAPLAQLEALEIPAPAMAAASSAAGLVPVRPMLGGLAHLPGMNLLPVAKLEFPNVAPLTLALAAANQSGVVTSSACSSSCPMGGKF